jgi:hypothetical protein
MKLTSRDAITAHLNNFFDDEFQHWEVDTRLIWIYQAKDGTGKFQSQKNLNYSVVGLIGKPVEVEDNVEDNSVSFIKTGTVYRKPYTMVTTITKTGDTYSVIKYWTFLYDTYLANMDKMRGNSSYLKAVEMTGMENPSDEDVATVMGTLIYGTRKDAPEIDPELVTLEVTAEEEDGRMRIKGKFMIDGVETNPLRWRWWVNPAKGVIGTTSSGKAAGEYIGGRNSFTVNTDFNDRHSFMIMNPEDVEIKCYAQYKEADGDMKMVHKSVTVDMSDVLPLFDYFGLA